MVNLYEVKIFFDGILRVHRPLHFVRVILGEKVRNSLFHSFRIIQ